MHFYQKKYFKGLFISLSVLFVFALLMIFGLKHNPNFNPSELIGKQAPYFEAPLASGNLFQFNSEKTETHWTVINFWSSSCYICREEAHELQNFYQDVSQAKKTNPQFLSVNIEDNSSTILQWQKDYSQTFPVIQDTKGLISVNFGVTGTPETFFISPNHIVRFRVAGSVNKNLILNFITWLNNNPAATESQSAFYLSKLNSES